MSAKYYGKMRYDPITEKPYCCVPAVLQMIQARRGLPSISQDDIGWDLGLIVPPGMKSEFTKVRTGSRPPAGYGTQTLKPEFSIESYFAHNRLPLSITKVYPSLPEEMTAAIEAALARDDDIILCYDSLLLFGYGDIEHVSLIEEFDNAGGQITVVDPAIGAPKRRSATIAEAFEAIPSHEASDIGGLWVVSERPRGPQNSAEPDSRA